MTALGDALAGRRPTAELLRSLASSYEALVPSHETKITHKPRGTFHPRKAFFVVSIEGARLNAQWNLTAGQLRDAINAVSPDSSYRLS
jgi:hypothetical protein